MKLNIFKNHFKSKNQNSGDKKNQDFFEINVNDDVYENEDILNKIPKGS